jgi:hypothetical protein
MSQATEPGPSTALVATLPERVFTRGGSSSDPREDLWEWVDGPFNARIDFRRYRHGFEAFVPSLKQALLPFVKGHSSAHVSNLQQAFSHFVDAMQTCPKGAISVQHRLRAAMSREGYIGHPHRGSLNSRLLIEFLLKLIRPRKCESAPCQFDTWRDVVLH